MITPSPSGSFVPVVTTTGTSTATRLDAHDHMVPSRESERHPGADDTCPASFTIVLLKMSAPQRRAHWLLSPRPLLTIARGNGASVAIGLGWRLYDYRHLHSHRRVGDTSICSFTYVFDVCMQMTPPSPRLVSTLWARHRFFVAALCTTGHRKRFPHGCIITLTDTARSPAEGSLDQTAFKAPHIAISAGA